MAGGHPIPDILDCTKTVLCTEIQNSRIENSRQKPEDCDKKVLRSSTIYA